MESQIEKLEQFTRDLRELTNRAISLQVEGKSIQKTYIRSEFTEVKRLSAQMRINHSMSSTIESLEDAILNLYITLEREKDNL